MNDSEKILNLLSRTILSDIIEPVADVYNILKSYNIADDKYISAIEETIYSTMEDCEEMSIPSSLWIRYFDGIELLENVLVSNANLPPKDFIEIFQNETNYSSEEIKVKVDMHCDYFGEDPKEYYKYLD